MDAGRPDASQVLYGQYTSWTSREGANRSLSELLGRFRKLLASVAERACVLETRL